jgi:hypothetical protein
LLLYILLVVLDTFSTNNTMTPDESYSVLGLTALLIIVTQKQFSYRLLEILLKLTRPGATILLLGGLVVLWTNNLHYTFLVCAILVIVLLKDIWIQWVRSDARRLYLETGRDEDRFDVTSSIDLQFASGTAVHDPPNIYHKTTPPPLLVFPPSAETLYSMNG